MKLDGLDYLDLSSHLSENEIMVQHSTRDFVEKEIIPIIDEYFEHLDPIFAKIGECENGRNIDDLLEGPVCHARFKRLN